MTSIGNWATNIDIYRKVYVLNKYSNLILNIEKKLIIKNIFICFHE